MSIADTLHDAVTEIDSYLQSGDDAWYDPNNLLRLLNLRDSMELMRCRLDADLEGTEPAFRVRSI